MAKPGLEPYHFGIEKIKSASLVHPIPSENGSVAAGMKAGMKTGMKIVDAILNLVRQEPTISIDRLSQATGKARSSIQEAIEKLKSAGVIRRIGPDKGGHWEIVQPQ